MICYSRVGHKAVAKESGNLGLLYPSFSENIPRARHSGTQVGLPDAKLQGPSLP